MKSAVEEACFDLNVILDGVLQMYRPGSWRGIVLVSQIRASVGQLRLRSGGRLVQGRSDCLLGQHGLGCGRQTQHC